MNIYFEHLKTITKHKIEVTKCCFKSGLYLQGILHDLSKYSITEFFSSAKYFQGNRSPIDAEKEKTGYSKAWLHHKGRNKHHWEYWLDFDKNGKLYACKIPEKYVYEMVCDFIGAGKVYSKEKWTKEAPYEYYLIVKDKRVYHKETLELFEKILKSIKMSGLNNTLYGIKIKMKCFKY